ncbi:hypothetical protein FHG87_016488 [Trinorchestia longiramus]|nr:hypothetical protein FHG87_016488 [Trinorchestia longiramus]
MPQFGKLLLHLLNPREPLDKLKFFQTIQNPLKLPLTELCEVRSGYNAFTECESDVEKLLTQKATTTRMSIGLEARLPPKIRTQRSVVCRQIDSWIRGKPAVELKQEITYRNQHLEEPEIIKFGQYTHVFKIEFTTINMASHVLQHEILCEHVKIVPSQIYHEKFIDILICLTAIKWNSMQRKIAQPPT